MRVEKQDRVSTKSLLLLCFCISLVVLTLFSNCSFLYPTNPLYDNQCFITVGRSIAAGNVLYRDIYEQKGPLLYFLHACADWIPNSDVNPFLEIYILEVFAAALTLFFLARTMLLYRGRRVLAFLAPLAVVIYSCGSFRTGDSAEEFALVMVAYVLYVTLRMLRSQTRDISRAELFWIGVLTGCAFWIKYTMVGLAVGAMLVPLAVTLRARNWRLLGRAVVFVLLGVALASLPVLIYFAVHGAFDALWEVYFYNNIFAYAKRKSIGGFLRFAGGRTFYVVRKNIFVVVLALTGWIHILRRNGRAQGWHIFFIALLTQISCLTGGRYYVYYALLFAPLAVFGFIAADSWLDRLADPGRRAFWARLASAAFAAALVANGLIGSSIGTRREDLRPYKLAAIIAQTPGATLVDLSGLDSGLYTATGAVPVNRYFCVLNAYLPEAVAEWRALIREGGVDYVYTGSSTIEDHCPEGAPYEIVHDDEKSRLYRLRAQPAQAGGGENRENRENHAPAASGRS